ncbi:mechanosensitive ion channel family protein [Litorimonas taeanensis]|uniref:mechanosensitive ion channel family protein n=1 Tax=Litorimonas taeanensis TaxID=568099 RepID=UPI0011C4AA06|nr:mechanosensitive ion channel family protein [Litorimonas taeanensis]
MDIVLEQIKKIPDYIVLFAPSVLLGFIIFIGGRLIVRKASTGTVKATEKIPNIDSTLARFFGSLVLFIGMGAVIVLALSAMKINLAFLATIVAALVLALGFALQDSLGDFASGIMLALFRPFKVDDQVEVAGETGVVIETGLFSTRLVTRDNVIINVANGAVFGGTIKNYFHDGKLRLDTDIGVSYDADLNKAIKAILSAVKGDARIYSDPAPWAKVVSLGDSAVVIQLRVWTDAEDHRKVKMDISQPIKKALDKAGIEIPYEHNTIVRKSA